MSGLFGTDSARGVTVAELSCEQAMQAGRAAAELLVKEQGGRIIVAKDKRLSSQYPLRQLHSSSVSAMPQQV